MCDDVKKIPVVTDCECIGCGGLLDCRMFAWQADGNAPFCSMECVKENAQDAENPSDIPMPIYECNPMTITTYTAKHLRGYQFGKHQEVYWFDPRTLRFMGRTRNGEGYQVVRRDTPKPPQKLSIKNA